MQIEGDPPQSAEVAFGEMKLLPLPEDGNARVKVTVTPERGFDVGEGKGRSVTREVRGGVVGLLIDARGRRPFEMPKNAQERISKLRAWNKALGIYPREI